MHEFISAKHLLHRNKTGIYCTQNNSPDTDIYQSKVQAGAGYRWQRKLIIRSTIITMKACTKVKSRAHLSTGSGKTEAQSAHAGRAGRHMSKVLKTSS